MFDLVGVVIFFACLIVGGWLCGSSTSANGTSHKSRNYKNRNSPPLTPSKPEKTSSPTNSPYRPTAYQEPVTQNGHPNIGIE
jgi:hypothetical protein